MYWSVGCVVYLDVNRIIQITYLLEYLFSPFKPLRRVPIIITPSNHNQLLTLKVILGNPDLSLGHKNSSFPLSALID